MSGQFIVIEGPDGAGTTTHSQLLAQRLEADGQSVLLTGEPTDGPIGAWVREEVKKGTTLPPATLQLLFVADRAWHVEYVITPALKEEKTVICDRYIPSTVIYGSVQGLNKSWLKDLNKTFIQPDKTLVLLPSFAITRERVERRVATDAFEEEVFQKSVYDEYRAYAENDPTVLLIDSSGDKNDVAETIFSSLH